jgi:hypothetical protein
VAWGRAAQRTSATPMRYLPRCSLSIDPNLQTHPEAPLNCLCLVHRRQRDPDAPQKAPLLLWQPRPLRQRHPRRCVCAVDAAALAAAAAVACACAAPAGAGAALEAGARGRRHYLIKHVDGYDAIGLAQGKGRGLRAQVKHRECYLRGCGCAAKQGAIEEGGAPQLIPQLLLRAPAALPRQRGNLNAAALPTCGNPKPPLASYTHPLVPYWAVAVDGHRPPRRAPEPDLNKARQRARPTRPQGLPLHILPAGAVLAAASAAAKAARGRSRAAPATGRGGASFELSALPCGEAAAAAAAVSCDDFR